MEENPRAENPSFRRPRLRGVHFFSTSTPKLSGLLLFVLLLFEHELLVQFVMEFHYSKVSLSKDPYSILQELYF